MLRATDFPCSDILFYFIFYYLVLFFYPMLFYSTAFCSVLSYRTLFYFNIPAIQGMSDTGISKGNTGEMGPKTKNKHL